MKKIINFEDAAKKTVENKQSDTEKADFPDFAEWYAEYLDHKSDFIRLVIHISCFIICSNRNV